MELKKCPFYLTEKDIGHKPYTIDVDGLWHVQCTCGARGPISPTQDWSIKAWNNRSE